MPGGRVATGSGRATKPDVPGWSLSTSSTIASPPARVERPSSMASAVVQRQTSTSSSWSRILMLGRSASRVAPSDQSSHRVRSSCELKHRLSGRIGRNSRQDSHAQHQAAMALAVYGLKSAFWMEVEFRAVGCFSRAPTEAHAETSAEGVVLLSMLSKVS